MSLTTNQILEDVRKKVLEESTELLEDAQLLMYVNEAYTDLRYRTFTNDQILSSTIALTSGVGSLPANFGTLYGDGYQSTTDRTPFPEKSIADFDRTPTENGVTIEANEIKVNPSTTSQIIIKYYPSYAALSASQNPQIHEYLHELLIYGGIYRAHEFLQNEASAQYYRQIYEDEFLRRTTNIANYQNDNADGGEIFNYQQLI